MVKESNSHIRSFWSLQILKTPHRETVGRTIGAHVHVARTEAQAGPTARPVVAARARTGQRAIKGSEVAVHRETESCDIRQS